MVADPGGSLRGNGKQRACQRSVAELKGEFMPRSMPARHRGGDKRNLKAKLALFALAASAFASASAAAPVQAADWSRREVVVERQVVRRPVATRIVYDYRPAPVRRVIVVERPYHPPAYGRRWHRDPWFDRGPPPRRWHDRSRCWLPERHLCR
jgi:hypothetical protein